MDSTNSFDLLLNDPGQALDMLLHQGSSGLLLLLAAGVLGAFGVGLAAQAFFRGRTKRVSWGNLAANVGGLAWLLPVAAVFALYGFWMRPNLLNLPDRWSPEQQPATQVFERASNARTIPVASSPNAAANSALTADSLEASTTLPAWVSQKEEVVTGEKRFVVVHGEIGGTVAEAEASARATAVEKARDDFAATFPQARGWEAPARTVGTVAIRREFVEEIDRKTSSGTAFRVFRGHDQVELSPAVRKQIFPLWKEEVVGRRIFALGGLGALLTLTFGTLAVYFRLDDRTSGLYRRRLKLAAVSVIAAGGFAAATLL
jgi:hypothetical protein